MRWPPVSSGQLVAAWITGAVAMLSIWWALNAWEARQRAYIESDFQVARSVLDGARLLPESAFVAAVRDHEQLMHAAGTRGTDLQRQLEFARPIRVAASLLTVAVLLLVTWSWSMNDPAPGDKVPSQ